MSEEHPTMREDEELELLSRVDIFESLSKEEVRELLRDLLQQNAEINLRAGEVFYTPGQTDGKLLILIKGRVRIYKMEGSREFTLEVVDAGTVFGEVAFTARRLRDAYAEATEPSILLAMGRIDVERLILEKPRVGLRIISLLSERLHYYETRLQDVTLKGVDLRRFRGLFKTENSARKGEHCHEQTRPTHRSFAEKLSGWLELPTRNIPFPRSLARSVSPMAPLGTG
jgi:CRP/FNR family cyclic AMP-dependent transcriptional regulator